MNIKEYDDIHNYNYLKCLNKIRKCFKIVESNNNMNNNNSDSTRDSNSDNSEH